MCVGENAKGVAESKGHPEANTGQLALPVLCYSYTVSIFPPAY